jgi:tRNA U38,U39,U40 pseudouridine synthase TruA
MAIERRCPIKTMRLTLTEGERLVPIIDTSPLHSSMRVYNLVFEAEAFLYKLIRRITGTLVHIAKGQMSLQDVRDRFACPPDYYDSSLPVTLRPNGLFLYEVKYNEQDFLQPPIFKTDESAIDDIDEVMMEVQEEDDESDQLDSKMMAVRH